MPTDQQLGLLNRDGFIIFQDRRGLDAAIRGRCHTIRIDPETILCRILDRCKFFVVARDRGHAPRLMMDGYFDFISLSTLGVADVGNYVARSHNTIIVDPRQTGATSYDIVFEVNPAKDRVDLSAYHSASAAALLAKAVDDRAGSTYISLSDGLDYLYLVGITKAQLFESAFIV